MPDVCGGSAEKGPQASLAQGVGLAGTEGREGRVATVPKAAPERLGSGWGSLGPGGGRGTPMPWSLLSLSELIWICNLVSTHPLPLFTHYLTPLPLLSKSLLRPGMIRQTPDAPSGPQPCSPLWGTPPSPFPPWSTHRPASPSRAVTLPATRQTKVASVAHSLSSGETTSSGSRFSPR